MINAKAQVNASPHVPLKFLSWSTAKRSQKRSQNASNAALVSTLVPIPLLNIAPANLFTPIGPFYGKKTNRNSIDNDLAS